MKTKKMALIAAALLVPAVVSAANVNSEFVGPPARTLQGCPSDADFTDEVVAKAIGQSVETVVRLREQRGYSLADICVAPKSRLDRSIRRVWQPKRDFPGEAASFRAMQQASDDGGVRPDGLVRASEQRAAMIPPTPTTVAGISPTSWTALGPGNIGGRVRAITINPSNTNDIIVGSVGGGLWRTSNGGTSWGAVNDFMANLAIASLARDPSNANTIYAGTGEGFFNADALRGFGIFKSVDGGNTWTHLTATNPGSNTSAANFDFAFVNRIAVHPTNSSIILAATTGAFCNTGGLWRSSDGGTSWTKIYGRRVTDVRFDPNTPNRVVVGEASHCDPVTSSSDGGGVATVADVTTAAASAVGNNYIGSFTRTKLEAGVSGRVEISFAPANSGLVLAVLQSSASPCSSGAQGRLHYSQDGGATWAFNSAPCHLASQGWYNNTIFVDPSDSRRIVVGGLDLYRSDRTAAVDATNLAPDSWWTTNTAITWEKISTWFYSPNSPHADNHAIVGFPGFGSSNYSVLIGNDGGIYKATDIRVVTSASSSNGWTNLNNGLGITQFYSGQGKNYGAVTRIYGGTQDNGSLVPVSGTTWQDTFGGDGGFSAVDPTDSNYIYGEYVFAAVHRSTDGGASAFGASYICNGITEGYNGVAPNGCSGSNQANFISPFILDPNNANTMLVGARSLWRSTNVKAATPTWTAIKPPITTGSYISSENISAIAVAPGNSNIIWVGHSNGSGAIYCTTNGTSATPTWILVTNTPTRFVHRIMIDPNNNNRVFITSGGFNSGNVRETTSGCVSNASFTDRHSNLPQAPVRTIVRHPTNANWLYVGTEVGIFASTDGGANWSTTNDGPGNVSVEELFWIDATTLGAATHGRGMFKTTVSSGTLQFDTSGVSVPENGGPMSISVSRNGGTAGAVTVSYATGGGTATAGADYTATSGVLNWADGEGGSKLINVPILNDALVEGPETFQITLSSPTGGAALGATTVLTVTINDDDTAPSGAKRGDLNGDGKGDIVWRNGSTGANWYWAMNGTTLSAQGPITTLPIDWAIQSTAVDFDGDGKSDILLRNMTTGQPWIWFMNANTILGGGPLPTLSDLNWTIAGTGDLNGDGKGDVVWRNTATGQNWWWALNGTTIIAQGQITALPTDWAIQATIGDFNGDGKTDILWRNTTTGQPWVWMMDSNNIIANGPLPTLSDLNWTIAGTGDLNGDGKADVVWRNVSTGANWYWAMNGTTITSQGPITTLTTDWQFQATHVDFDGDGKSDILLRNMTTGQPWIWSMNGNTITGGGPLPTLSDLNWQIRIKK